MNFKWNEFRGEGNHDEGYVEVFLKPDGKRAVVVISYLVQHTDHAPRILVTVLLEGHKTGWTDGTISSIFHDAENYIKNVMNTKFRYISPINNVQRQIFTLKNVDDFEYVDHGDYNFIDE